MPKLIDTLRRFLKKRLESGDLNPGDRLPSYHELCEKFSSSYATVRSAMACLEREGVVELVHGNGSFLAGARPIKIEFYHLMSSLDAETMHALLKKYIELNRLFIDVELKNVFSLNPYFTREECNEHCRAKIILCPYGMSYPIPGLSTFSGYGDYEEVFRELHHYPQINIGTALPFYSFSYQMGFNGRLMKKTGFDIDSVSGDFKWWKNYMEACRAGSIMPASICWKKNSRWPFIKLLPLLLSLKVARHEISSVDTGINVPFFNTPAGKDFLEICRGIHFEEDDSFCSNASGMGFALGSWISRQNKNRQNICIDELRIKPYSVDGRKIVLLDTCNIQAHLDHDITKNDTDRIWKLIKVILSRPFQKEFCGLTGAISVRRDIAPREHEWYSEEFSQFFPAEGDYLFHSSMFNRELRAYFSAVMENFIFYKADLSDVLARLDVKL
ncbi:MAG: putative transcriptional regulator of 2-aminoethylphosphonate degradation operons [Lentisphaerae bacterium ADurb.Bin242]|nr:MAG: putative transcriptional regulator of 2-aminoethylphosphonate degradation operons [Lentisphaerae bacterium ADurb.Bin242]